MKKPLPIGKDDFKTVIEDGCYYVDKTAVIEELIQNRGEVVLFPRPRRFGKSLFISMLEHFFDIEKKDDNKNLFKGLYISKSNVYKANLNRYPLIHLDFKDLKSKNFESTFDDFKKIISELYINKEYLYESLRDTEKKYFKKMMNGTGTVDDYKDSIVTMSKWLYRYYNEKTIILIDEYDTPMDSGYNYRYYGKIMDLIQPLFSKAFKGNDSLKMGVLTGVLRVGGESLFSSFNNPKIYDVMSEGYNEYFGFTEQETKELLEYYDLKLTKDVKELYDGYNFNGLHIYNPWSILNYADDKKLTPYWINTGSNTLIRNMLAELKDEDVQDMERLILGESISFTYEPKLSYKTMEDWANFNSVLNLLLVSGYLTYSHREGLYTYFKVPNNEVRKDLGNILETIVFKGDVKTRRDVKTFIKGIMEGDKVTAEDSLNHMIQSVSYHDNKESFYHGYVLSIFNTFLNDNGFIVKSNEESGYGRPDIIIKSKDRKLGMVFELKYSKTIKDMESVSKEGLKQLKEKNYKESLEFEKVEHTYEYVIVFHGKKAIVR